VHADSTKQLKSPIYPLLSPRAAELRVRIRLQEIVVGLLERHDAAGLQVLDEAAECDLWLQQMREYEPTDERVEVAVESKFAEITDREGDTVQSGRGRTRTRCFEDGLVSIDPEDGAARVDEPAARNATSPAPDPTSSTRIPGRMPASSSNRRVARPYRSDWTMRRRVSASV
jgi:hypothetical protein